MPCVEILPEASNVNANLVIMAQWKHVKIWMNARQTSTSAVHMHTALMPLDLTTVRARRVSMVTVEIAKT